MTNEEIRKTLRELAEPEFQRFTSSLMPGVDHVLGVRLPKLRKIAGKVCRCRGTGYLLNAWDGTYEEIMLQGLVLGYAKGEIDELLEYVRAFIPKIHDWSVNDCFCATFKIAQKHREKVWNFLMPYAKSDQEFEQRVVAVMLMDHFLTEEYIARVLSVWDRLDHPGYYRKMGVAWGVATAYAKYPKETYAFLLENHLDDETYNKAIQKMIESYRISAEDKEILRGMKRKLQK